MTLYEMLCRSTAQHPDKVCFRFESDEFTYKQTLDAVNRVGHYLLSKGISPGDRVVLVLPNIPAFFFSYFAVTGIGAVAVPINPVWTADEISYILRDADAKALIAAPLPAAQELACSVPVMIWAAGEQADEWKQILATGCNEPLPGPSGADDLGVFIYTSGTTGKPKGAMLTHKNLTSNVQSTIGALQVKSSDVFICVLPLFHCFAATVSMLVPLCLGAEIVLIEQFVPKIVLNAISQHKITALAGVPSMYVVMVTASIPKEIFSSVTLCLSGGAPLPISVLNRFEEMYGVSIQEGYGLSEASPVVAVNVARKIKPGTVGPPVPGVRVRTVDTHGNDVGVGQPGELLVQGENVMVGYFGLPEATAEALKDGWLHTGDVATIDEDGYVTIVDRLKDMIIVGGLKVYPREVEEVLYSHPKIKEAAVVGMKHAIRGESVKAVISLKDGQTMTANEVITYCRERLANYKVPKNVVFMAALPKSSTGKILRRLLVDQE
ncbi:MAG TPA: long-chain fatty acid--CoA ligase [Firmicutes bacterium]|jgi:long-chain acyl-CoA synthetase|nr:long-chain fatty acid--CoA ligase [Bacillota bacterium]